MYKLTVSGLAAEQAITIDGLGEFSNGSYEINGEQAEQFRTAISSFNLKRPTLLRAFKSHPNVRVETIRADQNDEQDGIDEQDDTDADEQNDDEKKGGDN